jgi:hypothetical protein
VTGLARRTGKTVAHPKLDRDILSPGHGNEAAGEIPPAARQAPNPVVPTSPVNLIVAQMPEFAETFSCPPNAKPRAMPMCEIW